jgi:hypothetical protein
VTIRRVASDGQKCSPRQVEHFEVDVFATLRIDITAEGP